MIVDYKLIYPSGTATAHLINSFHTPRSGCEACQETGQDPPVMSFTWGCFQWFYTAGHGCGFKSSRRWASRPTNISSCCLATPVLHLQVLLRLLGPADVRPASAASSATRCSFPVRSCSGTGFTSC